MKWQPVSLNGVEVYPFDSVDSLIDFTEGRKGILVAINAEKIVNATDETRAIINGNIGFCDGSGCQIALKQKGYKDASKIAGCELWLHFIEKFHSSRTFYLIGSKPEVIEETVQKLKAQFPDISIVGYRDGYLKSDEERSALIKDVAEKQPDYVFVAMGSPKQELLMGELIKAHPAVYQGLGGSFDVFTNHVQRAPQWWIDHNVEFAYRLVKEPKRIGRQIHLVKYAWWLLWKKL